MMQQDRCHDAAGQMVLYEDQCVKCHGALLLSAICKNELTDVHELIAAGADVNLFLFVVGNVVGERCQGNPQLWTVADSKC